MPESIILISAVVCVGAVVGLYFKRDNAAVLAAAIISFIGLLYGIAQYREQTKITAETQTTAKVAKKEEPPETTKLDSLTPRPLNTQDPHQPAVTISDYTSRPVSGQYVEVSGTLSNSNRFAIKNVVLRCGDKSFANGDVSTVIEKVVPPRTDIQITGVRLGPTKPGLPPTMCLIERYERAN